MSYMALSIKNLQKNLRAARTRNQMGWNSDLSGFTIGEIEYTSNNMLLAPAGAAAKTVVPHLTCKGSLDAWVRITKMYDAPNFEPHALAILAGFGAPLLKLTGGLDVRGMTINLVSNKSGTGKTTAQQLVNSIFGHPTNLLLVKADTALSKFQYMGLMNNLPVTMDEITNMAPEQLSDFIYDVPIGRGRHRMESQTNKLRVNSASWCTFAITSSNAVITDQLTLRKSAPDGEVRRLLEMKVVGAISSSKQESDSVFSTLLDNYGVAGPDFIKYVLKNREAVQKEIENVQAKMDVDFRFTQSDRYLSKTLAVIFAAGAIVRRLGLIQFEIEPLYEYALAVKNNVSMAVVEHVTSAKLVSQEALMTYINENISNTLVISSGIGESIPPAPLMLPRGPLRMRYEPDTKELWIPANALRDYFVERQIDVLSALEEMGRNQLLKHDGKPVYKRIAAGAIGSFSSGTVKCYCVSGEAVGFNQTLDLGA